ncbi:MAG TPA: hypothetical protein VF339_04950 [Gammaproteobacteria bacterium]
MAFWLRSVERRVAARGERVRANLAAVGAARRRFASGLRRELGKPKVLLALFAAGLGYGWLRRAPDRPAPRSDDAERSEDRTGRLARLAAAMVAGARIYAQVRRAAALVEPHRGSRGRHDAGTAPGSSAFRQDPSDEAQQHEAYERHERRE